MKKSFKPNLHVALMHYPVLNKRGETISSAVTNLDLHDISRAVKTYGAKSFYVVTPLQDQRDLVSRIVSHWTTGTGATYNPKRKEALEMIHVKDSLKDVLSHILMKGMELPKTVVTCAKSDGATINYRLFREKIKDGMPYLLMFGTAWGFSKEFLSQADFVLEPVKGQTDYNHLSVRSAAAVILDRLLGRDNAVSFCKSYNGLGYYSTESNQEILKGT